MTPSPALPSALQTPLTVVLPLKPGSSTELVQLLPSLQDDLRKSLAGLAQTHFFRCLLIHGGSELAMIATFDGATDAFLDGLVRGAGTILEQILRFVEPPAPLPIATRLAEFKRYVSACNI